MELKELMLVSPALLDLTSLTVASNGSLRPAGEVNVEGCYISQLLGDDWCN